MTVTSRMPCPTGGRTPCSAATGIPGRRATSLSPTCGARAAPMKASSGTPWSGARQTTAAPPGTARGTTRPAHRPAAALVFPTLRTWLGDRARSGETNTVGSHMGSHRQPTQCDSGSTEAFDNRYLTSHPATVADASRQVGPRSHRGSALLSTPPPRAKVTFQRCALRHLTHVADERTCVPSHRRIRCRRSFCRQALAQAFAPRRRLCPPTAARSASGDRMDRRTALGAAHMTGRRSERPPWPRSRPPARRARQDRRPAG